MKETRKEPGVFEKKKKKSPKQKANKKQIIKHQKITGNKKKIEISN